MEKSSLFLAYCTNIWNHYQASLCAEFVRLLGQDRFRMCLFEPVFGERCSLGWAAAVPDYNWIAGPPSSGGELRRLSRTVCDADVAVLGDCPQDVQAARAATGKLTFVAGERLWKRSFARWRLLNPRFLRWLTRYKSIANSPNVHYLPMGAYAAGDARRIGAYADRMWNWAYFAEVAPQPPQPRDGASLRVLWVGRMLDWKRVDLLLKAVAQIRRHPNFRRLDIVGTGPEKPRLLNLARKLNLGDRCQFREPMTPDQVREMMRRADLYVLSSNRQEGWGVTANEAMSEGAVLVANRQAGAAPMLIDHGRTGFLFDDGDIAGLAGVLETLLSDASLRDNVRRAAWQEVQRLWHPRVGAERLIALCEGHLGLAPVPSYPDGPCSPIVSRAN